MVKIRNTLFACIIAVLLFAPLAYVAANALLPDVVNAPVESELENRTYTKKIPLDIVSIAKGKTQDKLESFIADHIPNRDTLLLANAALQRLDISVAAAPFGYSMIPTYFESGYCEIEGDNVIAAWPEMVPTKNEDERSRAWIRTLNNAVEKHPEINFVYDCICRPEQTKVNPLYKRVSGKKVTPSWVQKHILDELDSRIDSFVDATESYEELKSVWIPTEEHWTLERALQSYNKIAERLSLKQFEYDNPQMVTEKVYGDYSRMGLDLDMTYDLYDAPYDFSDLEYYALGDAGGEQITHGKREAVLAGELEVEPYTFHGYTRYYGSGSSEAINTGENNGKTALVICDSLIYPLRRVIASNYEHTIFILPGNDRLKKSFEGYLKEYEPDDVIVIIHATKYRSFANRSPKFIGLED